jgi:hypothetical protein
MMKMLRIFWTIAAVLLTILLIGKFIIAAGVGSPAAVLPSAIGVFVLLYLLLMLEGMQVAGIQVKDLEKDAIEHYLERNPIAAHKDVMPLHNTFHTNFDGFVVGRQVFTILTVVSIAFLNRSIIIPVAKDVPQDWSWALSVFLNGGVFVFFSSTLIPAWWCQLFSQFMADGRAIRFLALPGSKAVLWIAMLLGLPCFSTGSNWENRRKHC